VSAVLLALFFMTVHSGPHLNNVFLEIYEDIAEANADHWAKELQYMKDVGIQRVVPSTPLNAYYPNYSSPIHQGDCNKLPNVGSYTAFYPSTVHPDCIHSVGNAIPTILSIAEKLGMEVYLGLLLPVDYYITPEWLQAFLDLSTKVFDEMFELFKGYTSWKGMYPDVIEISNSFAWNKSIDTFIKYYLKPINDHIKQRNPDLKTFASPYFVPPSHCLNCTLMSPEEYGLFWERIFTDVPSLDFIAPQDGVGAAYNTNPVVASFLSELKAASIKTNRIIWSNVEIWMHAPDTPLQPASCFTRRPASWDRIRSQLENEYPMVEELIAWEWHSYLSPMAGLCDWVKTNVTIQLYNNYKNYVTKSFQM